jgi:hypothetical protein
LPFGEDLDKALAVERQCQGAAQIGIVESRCLAIDQQARLPLRLQ